MNNDVNENSLSSKNRLLEIISIIKKYNVLDGVSPVELRQMLEELGPTFIKIGQILSNRPDMISSEYILELSKLRNDVKPMSYQEVLDILSDEYDKRLFQLFISIDKKPLGSASIAQVHKAILKNGNSVVIKVQRKNIKEIMITDIKLLRKALKMLHIEKILKNIVSFDDILDELLNTSLEEMNFLLEAEHIEEFYNLNKEFPYIKVPRVNKKLTTEKVIVMEYIDGYKIADKDILTKNGYDLNEIGEKLADNFIYQALDSGFFHADPHPDNIIITNGKIGYIDYGMMGRLNNKNKELLKQCMVAIFNDDIKEVERILLVLCDSNKEVDHIKLCNDIELILDKNKSVGIREINITKFVNDLISMLGNHKIKIPKDITMLVRGIVVLEGTLEIICPDMSLMQVFENKLKGTSISKYFNKDNLFKELGYSINSLTSLNRLPSDLHSFFKSTSRGDTKFNIELADSNKYLDRFEKMIHRIVVCILDVAFIIGAALLVSNGIETNEQIFLFYLFFVVGLVLTIWLFIKMYIDKLNRNK